MRRLLLVLLAAGVLAGTLAGGALAASSYCTPTGDYCYSAKRVRGVVVLRFDTFSFSDPVRTCVRAPDGRRDCRMFRLITSSRGLMGFSRRWGRHFPRRGDGVYRVTFEAFGSTLGPGATFRLGR